MSKKIIYLGFNCFFTHKRGVENVIDFQSSILDDYSYYIHWGDCFKVYKYNHLVCISIPYKYLWKFFVINAIVKNIFTKHKQQVVIHSHNALMSIFLYRKTELFTVHDGLYYQGKSKNTNPLKLLTFYIFEKYLYKKCHWVHFISDFTKSKSLYPTYSNNYSIISNTSNYEYKISRFNPNIYLFVQKYPFLENNDYYLIVRSIEERARIDLIINVAEKQHNKVFVIAGKGPLLNKMHDIVKKKNLHNIYLLGFIPDDELFLLYYYAKVIIVPAEYGEGFGLPIIEGYLFNKPVIASNKCAIPEVIINKEYLFENDIESIEKAMIICEKKTTNNLFIDFYKKHFSQKIISSQYKQLYNMF